ncbi:MAG: dTMP kinase [Thermoplasmata archaeon]
MTPSFSIYLAIEGIDGTGKTYVARHISEKFKFSTLQEPSTGKIGSLIKESNWDPITDFFLFMADRSAMLKDLKKMGNVVSDRSLYSSYAYQGYYLIKLFQNEDRYFDFFMKNAGLLPALPTHVFILYCDVDVALERVMKRGATSRFEKREYLDGVQNLYYGLRGRLNNLVYVDSNGSLDELYDEIDKQVTKLLQQAHLP